MDPKLVELKNNYPRFEIMVREEEKEEQIMERLEKKIKNMEETLGEQFEQSGTLGRYPSAEEVEERTKIHFVPTPQVCVVNDESETDPNRVKCPNDQKEGNEMFTSLNEKSPRCEVSAGL